MLYVIYLFTYFNGLFVCERDWHDQLAGASIYLII